MVENVQYVHTMSEWNIVRRKIVDNNWSCCTVEVEQVQEEDEEEEEDWHWFEDNEE